ncbi:MAG: hypothetical protein A3I44_04765 [Candidatus Sungbacteria bacterium RIFCSPLOWO2_02_FULL_51_17]|uniref:Uncharacterized protein n=1 Tax=Candidatus Sungbacteria bacterium RIFCSPHIGHO2_02_FULL_51_29 TaxID=1802273 RepID=A0A1G2KPB0_9BACT|nr:MAG: hypothetical protein A2676_01605 [Candidatus Sungbacteria bacterium RIFCSPHIGHO2_01_FULL_51_22]OHA01236.1 MAG: hypothetical protein A3C16_02805 [Candidatus Sungbacteria bacterium RIFCSPHIGHO2_02_FULL_51_29]OHA11345.1 MAG: hypothetical protein A3I44_04765 [Candidatus Sungbacteria bacterium RIFCSPLOWO2_02_FULL_51_17]
MTALAVIGFILMNLIGVALVPRLTAMGYIWYLVTLWGVWDMSEGVAGMSGIFLAIVTIAAAILDIFVLYAMSKKE